MLISVALIIAYQWVKRCSACLGFEKQVLRWRTVCRRLVEVWSLDIHMASSVCKVWYAKWWQVRSYPVLLGAGMAFQSCPKFRLGTRPSYYHIRQSLVMGCPPEGGVPVSETVPCEWRQCPVRAGAVSHQHWYGSGWEMNAPALKMGSGWDTTPPGKSRKSHKWMIDSK